MDGGDRPINQFVKRPAKLFGTAPNHVARTPGGELLVLELLFHALEVEVFRAFRGIHQHDRAEKSCQLIDCKQHLLHQMFRLYIHMTVAMTTDGMDHFFAHAAFMLLLSLTTKLII